MSLSKKLLKTKIDLEIITKQNWIYKNENSRNNTLF